MAVLSSFVSICQQHVWLALVVFLVSAFFFLVIFRLFFHSLAHIPGPKIAATTQWYEFYHDVIRNGRYQSHIEKMHEEYGPIVRISPYELHCNDPAFIDQVYAGSGSGKKRDKTIFYCNGFQFWGSCINTISHDLHRLRRSALNPFFSKASILRLEPTIRSYVDAMCQKIETYVHTKEPCSMTYAFGCMSTDVVMEYCLGWSEHYSSNQTFTPNLIEPLNALQQNFHVMKHFPWLNPVMNALPDSLVARMMPDMAEWLKTDRKISRTVDSVLQNDPEAASKHSAMKRSIFKEILNVNLPPEEKSRTRLLDEAKQLMGAGTETMAWALSVGVYYLLSNRETLSKLSKELLQHMPDPEIIPSWSMLENLPYLISVLHEALRFSCGVSTRLQRVPHEPLYYSGTFKGKQVELTIPARSAIGMSNFMVHNNPDIFPEPTTFRPERWLDDQGKRHRALDGYLLAFSKGSRGCIGINLAWAELHIALATFVRRFGDRVELFETGPAEVEWKYDLFEPGRDSYKGVRVLVH
ncbi:cytochrome P450 [Zopfia rhizophila CBS 207.26]|uniref:Cytochrome P450 n=1 Tax=Zopfia rhizophila CBS 207.26 TaxID=1314779 RepID=A0A6A6E7F6_9PEZI|nr:cytochrome P450 [Zopfia rhizophila CBS 207.26]